MPSGLPGKPAVPIRLGDGPTPDPAPLPLSAHHKSPEATDCLLGERQPGIGGHCLRGWPNWLGQAQQWQGVGRHGTHLLDSTSHAPQRCPPLGGCHEGLFRDRRSGRTSPRPRPGAHAQQIHFGKEIRPPVGVRTELVSRARSTLAWPFLFRVSECTRSPAHRLFLFEHKSHHPLTHRGLPAPALSVLTMPHPLTSHLKEARRARKPKHHSIRCSEDPRSLGSRCVQISCLCAPTSQPSPDCGSTFF